MKSAKQDIRKRVLIINSVCGVGSTGRICVRQAEEFMKQGYEVRIAYGRGNAPSEWRNCSVKIGSSGSVLAHGFYTRIADRHGLGSWLTTKKFLQWAEEFRPDVLCLHNIHGYYINFELLFEWIKNHSEMKVIWMLHDCWSFTGHCAHFSLAGCERWKSRCGNCPETHVYPASFLADNSESNFIRKKNAFTGVGNLELVVPSRWLANLVRESFLSCYPIAVSPIGIDTDVFKPTSSDFRSRYGLEDKIVILSVANIWNEKKGFSDILGLSRRLDECCAVVIVGRIKNKDRRRIPPGVIQIPHTDSAEDLAKIYTAADVFINPTYEDTYSTVNLEAQACGTVVITYDTGGCGETIRLEGSRVIPCGSLIDVKF